MAGFILSILPTFSGYAAHDSRQDSTIELLQEIQFSNLNADKLHLHPTIYAITQDAAGFMWFGTQDGLFKYDGNEVSQIGSDIGKPGNLSSNWVNDLHSDREGRLWVATRNGIGLYYPEEERFRLFNRNTHPTKFLGLYYSSIAEDPEGNLWFGSEEHGLVLFDLKTNQFSTFLTNSNDSSSLSSNKISDLVFDSVGNLYIATRDNGINVKLKNRHDFLHFNASSDIAIAGNNIRKLYMDSRGMLWVGTAEHGLFSFDLKQGITQHFQHDRQNPQGICSNSISDIEQGPNGNLWLATDIGLCQFSIHKQVFKLHEHDNSRLTSLQDNRVRAVYKDDGGVIWVGTDNGVSKWNASLQLFTHVSNQLGVNLSNNVISSFAQAKDGNIYVGTWGGGLNLVNPNSLHTTNSARIELLFDHTRDKHIGSLFVDSKDNLWVGAAFDGLYLQPTNSQDVVHFTRDSSTNSISANKITSINELNDGTIVISTYGGGVNFYQPEKGFTYLKHDPNNVNSLSSDWVYSVTEDEKGLLWIATENAGVDVYDRNTGKFHHLIKSNHSEDVLQSNSVYSILNTKKYLWFATQDGGISRLNKQRYYQGEVAFSHVRQGNGVRISSAYGLLEGEKGFIWASHGNGISRIHPEDFSLINFSASHNLQGRNFNAGAAFKGTNGQMYFGGANGFNIINPHQIPINNYSPKVRLTKFRKFNEPVPIKSVLNKEGHLVLDYSDSVIGFEFAALDFTAPENNQYKYQMLGLSDRWINLNENRITFSNLSAGEYQLVVKGSNNDGFWSDESLVVDIFVKPPVWQTWYAYSLYGFVLLMIVLAMLKRSRRKANENKLYQQRLEDQVKQRTADLQEANDNLANAIIETESAKDIAEKAAQAKADFLATMSHEIRTPMNSILGMNELLLKTNLSEVQKKYANMAFSSGKSLLRLINDILDFSKMEENKIRLENVSFDLPALIDECVYLLQPRDDSRYVEVKAQIGLNCPTYIKGDVLRFRQILNNLLGNAIKFTHQGSVCVFADLEDSMLVLKIIDTGIGIEQETQENIFKPFEQADSSTTRKFGGTGLGLSITKRLVELMDGSISISSVVGEGTTFTIKVPIEIGHSADGKIQGNEAEGRLDLDLDVVAKANVALITYDRAVIKQVKHSLQKLKLNYQQINNSESITKFYKNRFHDVLLIDAEVLSQLDWQLKMEHLHQRIICLYDDNDEINPKEYSKIRFIQKPIQLADLYESLAEKVSCHQDDTLKEGEQVIQFNAKVLLVEDAYTNQIVATEMLAMYGCQVDIAENGSLALKMVQDKHYDLVFMDCQMPVMDGFEATRKIRLWQEVHNQPPVLIIALTAGKGVGYLEECLGVGMDDFMLKPFNFGQMEEILCKHIPKLQVKLTQTLTPAQKSIEALPTHELIDQEGLNAIFDIEKITGRNVFPKVFAMFRTEMQGKLPDIKQHYINGDSDSVYQLAHAMKSLSANVGAKRLVDLCQSIEQATFNNDLMQCANEIELLSSCYEKTVAHLVEL
ncbi:two-component regulator propeller domain-containing protein [Thalassotalea aquiviva]|uniref:two-component regulator propeller domain-containing protein n=1 Tax=Thalassotalea aquiviva TaxID=3242415 RepID=UPI00352B0224